MINVRNCFRCFTFLLLILYSFFPCTAADWLCFTAETANAQLWCNGYASKLNIQYSLDEGVTWQDMPTSNGYSDFPSMENPTPANAITVANVGDKVYVKGLYKTGTTFDGQNNATFGMNGSFAVTGNVMSLVDGEGLTKTVPTNYCFVALFRGCSGLTKAPELPATELTDGCYLDMFYGCSALKEAPVLPATEMKFECYRSMFRSCISLTKAPDLPAPELENGCYMRMFDGCYKLNSIRVGTLSLGDDPTAINGPTYRWIINGPTGSGVFSLPCGSTFDRRDESSIPANFDIEYFSVVVFQNPDGTEVHRDTLKCGETPVYNAKKPSLPNLVFKEWDKPFVATSAPYEYYTAVYDPASAPDLSKCLCFTAEQEEVEFWCANAEILKMQYSLDEGASWKTLVSGEHISLPNVGDKAYLKGEYTEGLELNDNNRPHFGMMNNIAASGSVMSLLDGEGTSIEIPTKDCFHGLFENCGTLTKAPELPAVFLKEFCYYAMFKGCSALTEAPVLPAENMEPHCYSNMFDGCVSITKAPELKATSLADYCYSYMFRLCASLAEPSALSATTMKKGCYEGMFYGCMSLTRAPELPSTELADACYQNMFDVCASLTKAPELPATTLAQDCYHGMFGDCMSLVDAPALPATTLSRNCYSDMFTGCKVLTDAPELPATELADYCYWTMFKDCVALTNAPELPASTLREGCYSKMFKGCASLEKAPVLPATSLVKDCYESMFQRCERDN